jgi:glutathione S-transferase
MIRVRSTQDCSNTPRILFALEELGLPYELERVPDGTFSREWGSPGPTLTDEEVVAIEPGAILRHLARRAGKLWPVTLAEQAVADRWFEVLGRRVYHAVETKNVAEVERLLGFVDAIVARTPWLIGETFSMVDIYYSWLAQPKMRAKLTFLAGKPAFAAYLDRIAARPAFQRAMAVAYPNG